MSERSNATPGSRTSANAKLLVAAQRRADADKAMDDVKAAREAEVVKTARLRALRLAHEAAQEEAAAIAKKTIVAKPRKKATAKA